MRKVPAALLAAWVAAVAIVLVMPVDRSLWSDWTWTRHDAAIHAVLFFGFGLLGVLSVKRASWAAVLFVAAIGLLLGGGMEIVQGLLPWERGAKWSDFRADAAGVVLGVTVGWALGRIADSRRAGRSRGPHRYP